MATGSRIASVAVLLGAAVGLMVFPRPGLAQHSGVAGTPHNLSVSGPGPVRSLTETEVCKFCHIPHTAEAPVPLWGHRLSQARYAVPDLRRQGGRAVIPSPQPDGASRLCLSCHDGTVALGDVRGEGRPIPMAGGDRLRPGQKGFLGTDLTGSHPVSFVPRDPGAPSWEDDADMGLQSLSVVRADPDVRLDSQGKMQCTTCHDPHSDRYYQPGSVPRFWVKPTVEGVCLTCHVLR